jgi:phosphoribosyl 1,2-cyclic phosphodiesterase
MSLSITSLNSGSNGNCYYVGNEEEAVFIDAGLSCRETERRMAQLQLPMQRVKAIFVSHEHHDHVAGVDVLARRYNLPVFLSARMHQWGRVRVEPSRVVLYKAHQPVLIGSLRITAFPKLHDACDPHSFTVCDDAVNVGVFTDLGFPCGELIRYFKHCHAAFLEANYDEEMLRNGPYPMHLKNRIQGGKGHLSNHQAVQLMIDHKPSYMSHLLLAHLSKENNCPNLAERLFRKHAGNTTITVASRYAVSPVYHIKSKTPVNIAAGPIIMPITQQVEQQLSLF